MKSRRHCAAARPGRLHRRHDDPFGDIGEAGLTDATRLAKGIALILNATLIGLLIAIPCLIFWSYYSKKVETIAVEMETLCDEFIRRQYREEARK